MKKIDKNRGNSMRIQDKNRFEMKIHEHIFKN
jgi:hypothetical protein